MSSDVEAEVIVRDLIFFKRAPGHPLIRRGEPG